MKAVRAVLLATLLLAITLITSKAQTCYLGWLPRGSMHAWNVYLRELATLTQADVLYSLCVGLGGWLLIASTARYPRLGKVAWVLFGAICAASVFYAVLHVYVFDALQTPLTYSLIYLAGDIVNMRSSVAEFVTPQRVMMLIAAPLGFLLLWMLVLYAAPRPKRPPSPRRLPLFDLPFGRVAGAGLRHQGPMAAPGLSPPCRESALGLGPFCCA